MRAIVCGAGIAGLTLAWWLDREGWEVLLVERAPGPRDEGYMIDFFGPGYDVAERMGLLPSLERARYPIPEIVYVDGRGRRVAGLDYDLFARLQCGRLVNVMRGDLARLLCEALPERIRIRYGLTVERVEQGEGQAEVTLSDGTTEHAALLVGADGLHSRVRELSFGEEERYLRYLGFHTAAYVFEDRALGARLQGDFRSLTVPGREAGFYPIAGGRTAAFFVHRTPERRLPASPCEELARTWGDLGWIVPEALAHCQDGTAYYDLVAQIEMPRWSQGRVTLVGDACQAVSLLAGQGASLAMAGAFVLARELAGRASVEEALERYESRFKPVTLRTQSAGRRAADWFAPAGRWRIAACNTALRAAGLPGLSWLLRPVLGGGRETVVGGPAEGPHTRPSA